MEEPLPTDGPSETAVPAMSLPARLANVFVAPSEVFESVRRGPPQASSWIVPAILIVLASVVSIFIMFSQPSVIQQLKNSEDAQETRIRQQVTAGKLTQAAADQQIRGLEMVMTPSIMKTLGAGAAAIGAGVYLFLGALVFWMIARLALGGNPGYGAMLEMVGLAMMISLLGGMVALLLTIIFGNAGITLGPAMLISHFDAKNPLHQLLASINVMSIWFLWVLSVGLGRLAGASTVRAGAWVFGLWAVLRALSFALLSLQAHLSAAAAA